MLTHIYVLVERPSLVDVLFVLVHPNLSYSTVVLQ